MGAGVGMGRAYGRRWSDVHRSAPVCRHAGVYPGTQFRQQHRASLAMVRLAAQPQLLIRSLHGETSMFIVRVGLLPSTAVTYVTHYDIQL